MTIETLKQLFKFSWSQTFSDQNGKSSIVPIDATVIIITGCIGFLKGTVLRESDTVIQAVVLVGIGAGLLGYHKMIDGKPVDFDVHDNNATVVTKTDVSSSIVKVEQPNGNTPG